MAGSYSRSILSGLTTLHADSHRGYIGLHSDQQQIRVLYHFPHILPATIASWFLYASHSLWSWMLSLRFAIQTHHAWLENDKTDLLKSTWLPAPPGEKWSIAEMCIYSRGTPPRLLHNISTQRSSGAGDKCNNQIYIIQIRLKWVQKRRDWQWRETPSLYGQLSKQIYKTIKIRLHKMKKKLDTRYNQ